jgi:hypothetical protein
MMVVPELRIVAQIIMVAAAAVPEAQDLLHQVLV